MRRWQGVTLLLVAASVAAWMLSPDWAPTDPSRKSSSLREVHQSAAVKEVRKGVAREVTLTADLQERPGVEAAALRHQERVDRYLKEAGEAALRSGEAAASEELAQALEQDLVSRGLDRGARAQVLSQVGRHLYNQAMIDGEESGLKRPLLRLAVSHLERAKSI
ncbi:MAG: hypothetical protein IT285_13855 [Bdellovibrionales bacterium]|nr:hypothetical protein [Bdellovibrionales bacterium]